MPIAHRIIASDLASIRDTLDNWHNTWPDAGIVALVPEAERAAIPVLQAACRERDLPLFGAMFPALVTDRGFSTTGLCLLCFAHMPPAFLVPLHGDASDLIDACERHLNSLPPGTQPCLFMIFDGMTPNIASLLHALYATLETRVRYAGANAGSETFQAQPCLFDHERFIGDAVLGLLLPDSTQVVVAHGYPVSKALMRATSAEGNRIDTIDHRNAFAVYQEVIAQEYGVQLTKENFYDHAVHFPFGLVTAVDVLVRIPVAFNDDGSLFCVGEVPPNTLLKLLRAPALEESQCIQEIARQITPGSQPGRLLNFYCAGRRMHFGAAAESELAALREQLGVDTIYGALTLGEIDQHEDIGMPRFHNATLVCLPQR